MWQSCLTRTVPKRTIQGSPGSPDAVWISTKASTKSVLLGDLWHGPKDVAYLKRSSDGCNVPLAP